MKLTFQLMYIALVVYGVHASVLPDRKEWPTSDKLNDENMTTEGGTTEEETTEKETASPSTPFDFDTTVSKFDPKDSSSTVDRKVEDNVPLNHVEQDQASTPKVGLRSNFEDSDASNNGNILTAKERETPVSVNPIQSKLEDSNVSNDGSISITTQPDSKSTVETDSNTKSGYQVSIAPNYASILNMDFKTIVLITAGILTAASVHTIFQ